MCTVVSMETFVTSIKQKYQERLINREKQWPPCHSDKLVRLELVERKKGEGYSAKQQRGIEDRYRLGREGKTVKRTPLAYGDIFKEESGKRPVRKVLVEGDAGIGKTTFCIAVSEDWANGKLFHQFELVLLLPLQMKVVSSASSLPKLLELLHSCEDVCDSVASFLKKTKGKSVLIIADGWDELNESERHRDSFLYQLLFEMFPFISVIVTSRPSTSALFHRFSCIDRFVEVRGFSKEHIAEYIQSEFASNQEKAGRLLEQLECNPLVESVCSVPLNCTIICHLWRTLEEAFPTTMTELYTKIILIVILRNIQKADFHRNMLSLSNFDALPTDLQESWQLLCQFAFQALKKDQLVFSQEELADFFPQDLVLNENILCFGLLQSSESIFVTGRGMSFHFLHLTFQEYLAAFHLAKRLVDRQSSESNYPVELFRRHEHFAIVSRFFFGIYFNVLGFNDCAPIRACLSSIGSTLVRCHCVFESRNADIADHAIGDHHYGHKFQCHPSNAYDCTAILYVMDKLQKCHSMDVLFGSCHITENQIRALTNSLIRLTKNGMLKIEKLDLSGNELTSHESVSDLLCRASSSFSLQSLNLGFNKFEPEKIVTILTNPSLSFISYLNLSGNTLGVSGLQALENALSDGHLCCLKQLDLSGCLTDDADINATALVTFLKSLSDHCNNLYEVDFSNNNLGVPGASALAAAIKSYQQENLVSPHDSNSFQEFYWLKSVKLNNTKLGDEGLYALIEILESSCWFDYLYLQSNGIHANGVKCLAKSICSKVVPGGALAEDCLDLGDNPLGIEGIIAVGEILSRRHQTHVDLSRCHLTIGARYSDYPTCNDIRTFRDMRQQLCQIPKSDTVTSLTLNDNCFTGERIQVLAGFILLCKHLLDLSCVNCNITSNDFIQLLEIITKGLHPDACKNFFMWDLQHNNIDDEGVLALPHHVKSLFPILTRENNWLGIDVQPTKVYLDGNPVSRKILKILNRELYPYSWLLIKDIQSSESNEEDLSTSPDGSDEEEYLSATSPSGSDEEEYRTNENTREEELGVTDRESTSPSMYEGRGDPQALPQECATAGATPSITGETDLSRKRKSVPEGDVQKPWPLHPQCIEQSRGKHDEKDFGSPPRKRRLTDDLQTIEHCFVDLIKWEDVPKYPMKIEDSAAKYLSHKARESSCSSQFQGSSAVQSRPYREAVNRAQVPFLFHEILMIDNYGMEYIIEDHDVTVRFPFGAVAEGEKLQFEIGVAMYGPFKFMSDKRPISPILWLCPLDESLAKLNKPFQFILPHFLSGDKVHNHQVGLAKANHRDYEEYRYTLHVCDTKPIFVSTGSKSYGIIETNHCCFYCLQANNTPQITRDAEYALVTLESVKKQEVHFCAIYLLNTCLKSLEEQFPLEEGYQVSRCSSFKFKPDLGNHLNLKAHAEHNQCAIAMDPIPAKIQEIDVNFWNTNFETLQLKHQRKMYPPRIKMTVDAPNIDPRIKLLVKFDGCSSDSQLDMEIFFPLRLSDAVECARESDVTTVRSNTILMNCNGLADIEHQYLALLEWQQCELSSVKQLKLYSRVSHKWKLIATRLGFEPGNIDSLRRNYHDDDERVIAVFQRWFDDAKNLPNARKYPFSWQGLINLLEEAELGEVAKTLHAALSSPQSSVRQTLSL